MRNSRLAGSAPSSSLRARSPLLGVGAGNARPEEIQRPMPLGETIQDPNYITHRAITIHARPEEVWPWLAQMRDLPRGGFYSYAWIERLMGMKVENAARILLECQSLENGQALDRAGTMLIKACGPNRCLVLGPPDTVGLATALCIRRMTLQHDSSHACGRAWTTPKRDFLALAARTRPVLDGAKMLLEIKKRAEARVRPDRAPPRHLNRFSTVFHGRGPWSSPSLGPLDSKKRNESLTRTGWAPRARAK